MKSKILIVAGFVVACAIVLWLTSRKSTTPDPDPAASASASPSASGAKPAGPVTEITFLYSSEKQEWIEAAVAAFSKEHPEIKVTARAKGSLDLEQAILDGKEKPTLWSPADSLVQNLLDADWDTKTHSKLFATSGEDAPQRLVITPLVWVVWQDRADVLTKAGGGEITWKTIHKAVAANDGWPSIKGDAKWGFVKLGHTDPTRSNSGLQTLFAMTFEYYDKKKTLEVGDLLAPKYQDWIKETEKGVSKFETSTGAAMKEMILFGPSKYDIAVTYENLAIGELAHAEGRWGALRIVYPSSTFWSDHPVAILQADWVTPAQKTAARAFVAYLKSRPMQEAALALGFRPADPAVPLKSADAKNPFATLADRGVKIDLPPAIEAPNGSVVRNLLMMWQRVVGAR